MINNNDYEDIAFPGKFSSGGVSTAGQLNEKATTTLSMTMKKRLLKSQVM